MAAAFDFEWDAHKAATNVAKHGVTFAEASTIFGDARALKILDWKHSSEESRFVLMGSSSDGRLLVVCYTERPPRTRIISARPVNQRERRQYEAR